MPNPTTGPLEFRRLGAEGVIVDPVNGQLYRLKPPAADRWEELLARDPASADGDALEALMRLDQVEAHMVFAAGSKPPPSQSCPPKFIWDPIKRRCIKTDGRRLPRTPIRTWRVRGRG